MNSVLKSVAAAVVVLVCISGAPASAQCIQQQKLTASDTAQFARFGTSVSISGETAVVGVNNQTCEAPLDCREAYVYRFNGTYWVEEEKLTASDPGPRDRFGFSVSVSGDTVMVGAFRRGCAAGAGCGAVYAYRFDGTSWVEEQKLTASDAAPFDDFGYRVSVSGDTALVGAYHDEPPGGYNSGSAYVFRFDGTSWVEEQKLTASDAAPGDWFGHSVSLSGDTALVGAHWNGCAAGNGCGAAYVFRFNGTSWVEEQKLTASDAEARDFFGESVSVSGNTAVVGAYRDDCAGGDSCGSAYVYRFDGTSWVEEQRLTAADAATGDDFGISVSVSGTTAVVGAHGSDCGAGADCGAVYVFRFDGTSWVERQRLTALDATESDQLGSPVSVSGDTVIAGARVDDCAAGPDCGAAYVFSCGELGACCLGTACSITTGLDCQDSGGTFFGVNSTCDAPDADGDGFRDECDGCPDDRFKIEPGICGCGLEDADSDGDGVADCTDQCPGADDNPDSDGDGVPDCTDKCPGVDDTIYAPECIAAIPTVSEWGLVTLALLALTAGKLVWSRRHTAAA